MCDLKAAQLNMQHSLIWQFMLYEFEWGYYTTEAAKNIFRVRVECAVDHSTVTR